MVDNDTLLSHLIPRITERTEDIAVEALGYILNKSPAARGALEYPVKADGLDSGLCRHDSSSEASETLKPGFRCCRCLLIATVRRRAPTTFPDYLPRLPSPTTLPGQRRAAAASWDLGSGGSWTSVPMGHSSAGPKLGHKR